MKLALLFVTLSLFVLSPPVIADEFEDSSLAFCGKIKACIFEELGGKSSLSVEQIKEVDKELHGLCRQVKEDFTPPKGNFKAEAASCMWSLSSFSCRDLMALDTEEPSTPECEVFEKAATEAN
ncbi:MAG: hypothetical protein ABJN40_17490 [Sneathiella sp.]